MDFELDDDQAALRDVSRRMLGVRSGPAAARRLAETDDDLWQAGAEIGWLALAVPEEHDGLGRGLVELSIVAEELGRAIATGPFMTAAVIARLLPAGPLLARLVAGEESATWALAEPDGSFAPRDARTRARADGKGFVLDGVKTAVEAAASADWLLVTADENGSPASYVVRRDAPGVSVVRQRVIDETRPRYLVRLDGVRAEDRVAGSAATHALADAATLLTSADALGAAEALFAMTLDYATTRHQFGRAIGGFQAVKHALADMLLALRGTRAAVYYAAMATDASADEAELAVAVAKSYCSAGLSRLAGQALQLHGGIGFTWEHDLHLYLRRIKADEILYGDSTVHRQRVLSLQRMD